MAMAPVVPKEQERGKIRSLVSRCNKMSLEEYQPVPLQVLDQAIGFEFPRSSGTENTSDNNSRSSTASLSTSPQLENQVHHLNSSLIPPSLSSSTPRKEAKRKAARSARKQSAPKRRRQNGPGSARKSATGVLGEKVSRAASTPSKTIPEYLPPKSS
eukprot:245696_1